MTDTTEKKDARGGGIQSLERAAALLQAVADRPGGITLAELSAQVGLHTSTAFHLTKTLVSLGFLLQDAETKRYRIGTRLFTLAAGAMNDNTLLTIGTPILERLSVDTGEASHLAVRSRQDIVLVARMAAPGMLQMSERAGVVRPAHATAIGKILLAFIPHADRNRIVSNLPLPPITPKTITDREQFLAELAKVESQGIAHDICEFDTEVRCAAMPVRDFTGRCVAAIGISGPIWRMTPETVAMKTKVLARAAEELSGALGYRRQAAAE